MTGAEYNPKPIGNRRDGFNRTLKTAVTTLCNSSKNNSNEFEVLVFDHRSCAPLLIRSPEQFYVKTIFHRKFFSKFFTDVFWTFFLCTTIDIVFGVFLCKNVFLKKCIPLMIYHSIFNFNLIFTNFTSFLYTPVHTESRHWEIFAAAS